MYGYDFRGLGKRNRAAFKEADDVANTRIPRVTGAKRGVGDGLGAKSDDDAFGDVTNAARRGEAAAPKALSGVGLEASVENNEPKDAAGASTTTTTTAVATLKFVKRADGGGIGGAPVALEIFAATLCRAITNNETVRGVDFESIISEIYLRVSPSACTRDEFVSWLTRGAPMFATTGVPNSDMDDVAMADESREFRQESSLAVWSSPLNAAESSFAWSSPLNAVRVAAKALDASDDETREALEEAETAKGVSRFVNDGLVFAYVGESVDVERRINDHLTALIGDGRADTIQRGHALVREAAARKGEDPADSFDFRAWVLAGYDEASVRGNVRVAAPAAAVDFGSRAAIAGAGFFQEAVWTVYYGTLHGHTASEGVIGMNFSQPGVCHPSQGDGVDSTDDMTSWDAMKALIKSGKTTTTTTTTGSHERSKEKEFKCAVCYKEISLLTNEDFAPMAMAVDACARVATTNRGERSSPRSRAGNVVRRLRQESGVTPMARVAV
eukprot:CAMPEP_0179723294 /NCGR_PEP_ID=MMETSP0938-20121108/5440_1 /TAXON_ID=548131 ORGANISM="Ostreococcus mediterraneus, Strain clade-D-RCC1107" /NCGR_SAMPLE_ID=MMETSP0938 /ASSEMBLY_ACC=CAM_ASM_000576 /LENGTH=499 /DNA_ID=CAMNT_0021597303 /DNA_START=78 /DNA_END=1576 /DNA_ORIENTATION=-